MFPFATAAAVAVVIKATTMTCIDRDGGEKEMKYYRFSRNAID